MLCSLSRTPAVVCPKLKAMPKVIAVYIYEECHRTLTIEHTTPFLTIAFNTFASFRSLQIFNMDAAGVLVSCSAACNTVPRRCSGMRLSRDWVLTTGSILSNVLQDISDHNVRSWKNFVDSTYQGHIVHVPDTLLKETEVTFSVITSHVTNTVDLFPSTNKHLGFERGNCHPTNDQLRNILQKSEGCVQNNKRGHGNFSKVTAEQPLSSDTWGKHEEFKSVFKYVWRSTLVSEAVDTILSSWVLGSSTSCIESDSDVETESEIAKQLIPLFLILKLETDYDDRCVVTEYNSFVGILNDLFDPEGKVLRRGQSVVVESTPFGNYYFHNSISEGIISNVVGPGHCLLLTDASTAIGCEGGPISMIMQR